MIASLKNIAKRKRGLIRPTPEENAEINRQIAADPDTLDLADPKNAKFLISAPGAKRKVLEIVARHRGQRGPQKSPTKVPISIRVDADIVNFFKARGPGWQSKVNETLRQQMERILEEMEWSAPKKISKAKKPGKVAAKRSGVLR
jgi:uncharacterized protein (DUF4415 family)